MARIALIGYRGSGKSTIARILAKELGYKLIELDRLIDERSGASIPEIVSKFGWERFRELETELLKEALNQEDVVLDLGGGIVEKEGNRELISRHCFVVWLKASPEVLIARIKESSHRPSLTGKSFIEEVPEVLARREPLYSSIAELVVDTEKNSPEQAVKEIIRALAKNQPD